MSRRSIAIATIVDRDLHGYTLSMYCPACRRQSEAGLAGMVVGGAAATIMALSFPVPALWQRCRAASKAPRPLPETLTAQLVAGGRSMQIYNHSVVPAVGPATNPAKLQ